MISFMDVKEQNLELKQDYLQTLENLIDKGMWVIGDQLKAFEQEFAQYCGVKYSLGVSNGLEALFLTLKAYGLGPGDEVIVPGHTFIATWFAVSHTGAQPIPVDVNESDYNINCDLVESAITDKTKAIIAVHLYGYPADMDRLQQISKKYNLKLIEDAAQAHGATYKQRVVGSLADASCFSFYPAKNLGALGDGGAICSDDKQLIDQVSLLRNYGSSKKYDHQSLGYNKRLHELQAGFLRHKLKKITRWNKAKQNMAHQYLAELKSCDHIILPKYENHSQSAWHLFVIRNNQRKKLMEHLQAKQIGCLIHYPTPCHQSGAYTDTHKHFEDQLPVSTRLAQEVLSLPIGPTYNLQTASAISQCILEFVEP